MALTSKNFCLCEGRGTYWLKQNIVLQNVVYLDALKEQSSTKETGCGADGPMKNATYQTAATQHAQGDSCCPVGYAANP
jgi:hypothetical protein